MKTFSNLFLISLLSGATTLGAYKWFIEKPNTTKNSPITLAQPYANQTVSYANSGVDFTQAAENTLHTVVHVKNVANITVSNPILEFFYGYKGGQQQTQVGSGSGVIISADGYIVTNNHVVKDASEIEITLNNNKTYKAKLVGTDSKMDIALLKVEANESLPYATFGDSDNVKVGEWVLAVGNPYNLNSTVTAGIVSAKARNLGSDSGIQSFIQTDAAVNPGNSGGALVNTRGELIGINTMISSVTGAYVGYSFAVPSNITRKIIEDIMEFGNVQRGILGIEGGELNGNASKELGIKDTQGFYIAKVMKNSGAEKAGLTKGDIIIKLDEQDIKTYADLLGYINTKRPNETVKVTYKRNDKTYAVPVKLVKNDLITFEYSGLELQNLDSTDKKKFNIDYGVKVKEVTESSYEELKGNVILSIDGIRIKDLDTATALLGKKQPNASTKIEVLTQKGNIEWYIFR